MQKRSNLQAGDYVDGILSGNIAFLSRAITLIESTLPRHQLLGEQIMEACLPYTGRSVRIGITGVPGVGKSSFIEQFGLFLTWDQEQKIAVLAIDPSSSVSGGSILGDKTRMEQLSVHPRAFIRPSPAGKTLGGVARKTRESILLCEAAGYQTIFVETVGVGQSETAVHSMVDFFLLLMLAGAGDELQGIKRGIMEMADALVVTKADGQNKLPARTAATAYKRAMHLLPAHPGGWIPETATCSALEKDGMDRVWAVIDKYHRHTQTNGYFMEKRKQQAVYWMDETIQEYIRGRFFESVTVQEAYKTLKTQVLSGSISSYKAARLLIDSKL